MYASHVARIGSFSPAPTDPPASIERSHSRCPCKIPYYAHSESSTGLGAMLFGSHAVKLFDERDVILRPPAVLRLWPITVALNAAV
jgi:hypothetical protein